MTTVFYIGIYADIFFYIVVGSSLYRNVMVFSF